MAVGGCRSGNGRLTLRELRRSDLVEALELLDTEDDINKVGSGARLHMRASRGF